MKKILIINMAILISCVSYGSTSEKENWKVTPRIGINANKDGAGVDVKLLRNFTKRFRFGFELGYSHDPDHTLLFGVSPEFDIYKNKNFDIYANSSVLWAYSNKTGGEKKKEKSGRLTYDNYKQANIAYKIGVGVRFENSLGLETGAKSTEFKYKSKTKENYNETVINPYIEITYTF